MALTHWLHSTQTFAGRSLGGDGQQAVVGALGSVPARRGHTRRRAWNWSSTCESVSNSKTRNLWAAAASKERGSHILAAADRIDEEAMGGYGKPRLVREGGHLKPRCGSR